MRHQCQHSANKKRRATIAMPIAARRVCNGNGYSAMETNLFLPPKWISVILLF